MEQIIQGKIVWLYGQPESGKTTLAKELQRTNPSAILIDGDELRRISHNQDYGIMGRIKNISQAGVMASYLSSQGRLVIVSLVTPYRMLRISLRSEHTYFIYLKTTRNSRGIFNTELEPPTGNDEDLIVNTSLEINSCLEDIKTYTGLK